VIGSTREVVGKKVRVGLLRGATILASPLTALAEVFEDAETVEADDVVEDIDEDELLRWALLLGTNILGRSSGIGEFRLFCEASPLAHSLLLRVDAAGADCCELAEGATAVMALETQNYQGSLAGSMSFDIVSSLILLLPPIEPLSSLVLLATWHSIYASRRLSQSCVNCFCDSQWVVVPKGRIRSCVGQRAQAEVVSSARIEWCCDML